MVRFVFWARNNECPAEVFDLLVSCNLFVMLNVSVMLFYPWKVQKTNMITKNVTLNMNAFSLLPYVRLVSDDYMV